MQIDGSAGASKASKAVSGGLAAGFRLLLSLMWKATLALCRLGPESASEHGMITIAGLGLDSSSESGMLSFEHE